MGLRSKSFFKQASLEAMFKVLTVIKSGVKSWNDCWKVYVPPVRSLRKQTLTFYSATLQPFQAVRV